MSGNDIEIIIVNICIEDQIRQLILKKKMVNVQPKKISEIKSKVSNVQDVRDFSSAASTAAGCTRARRRAS